MKYTCKKQNEEIFTVTSPNEYKVGDMIDLLAPDGTVLEKVEVLEVAE